MDIFSVARSFHDYIPNDARGGSSDLFKFGCEHSARQFAMKVKEEYFTEIKESEIMDSNTEFNPWMVAYAKKI
jgi:hypothetical protein